MGAAQLPFGRKRRMARADDTPDADAASQHAPLAAQVLTAVAFLLAPAMMMQRWVDRMRTLVEGGDKRALWKFLGLSFLFMMMVGFFVAGTPLAHALTGPYSWVALLIAFPIVAVLDRLRAPRPSVLNVDGDGLDPSMQRKMPDGL